MMSDVTIVWCNQEPKKIVALKLKKLTHPDLKLQTERWQRSCWEVEHQAAF
jgi:hypothetical protein